MFGSRTFRMSFLFSLGWHLAWLSLTYIVITPTVSLQDSYSDVNFLGPILEKTAFEIMVEESRPQIETLYQTRALLGIDEQIEVAGPGKLAKKDIFQDKKTIGGQQKQTYLISGKGEYGYLTDRKDVFYHFEEKVANRFIEGPAKTRLVALKPVFRNLSKALYGDQERLVTKLKFILSDDGNVELVEFIVSSGYPQVDLECRKYLKQWKFYPKTREGLGQEKDWGIITLNVRLE